MNIHQNKTFFSLKEAKFQKHGKKEGSSHE